MKYSLNSKAITFHGERLKHFLLTMRAICDQFDTDFMIVGAFARDIILENIFQDQGGAITQDIDIGISMVTWQNYERIIEELLREHHFTRGKQIHEFISEQGILTDILPYGEIEENRMLTFPQHPGIQMNMMGFQEAYALRLLIEIDKEVVISIPSPAGFILLKFFAWNDRFPSPVAGKHITDIGLILNAYYDANISILAPHYYDLLDEMGDEFDPVVFSARVLTDKIYLLLGNHPETLSEYQAVINRIVAGSGYPGFIERLASQRKWKVEYAERVMNAFREPVT